MKLAALDFIKCDDGTGDEFVHATAFQRSEIKPAIGLRLSFERAELPDGRTRAVKLRLEIA